MPKPQLNERTTSIILMNNTVKTLDKPVLYPFALEELLAKKAAENGIPILHLWKHPKALVLGLRDRRLTHAENTIQAWQDAGYSIAVRHSGGAAVPLDQDVINMTLMLPKHAGKINFNEDFETMVQLLSEIINHLQEDDQKYTDKPEKDVLTSGMKVNQGEVQGSYCPGEYDLSILGRKFCGMAQRRQVHALAVQAFILLRGKGERRTEQARQFYTQAAAAENEGHYPEVSLNSMASLDELLGHPEIAAEDTPWTDQRWMHSLYAVLKNQGITMVEGSVEKWFSHHEIIDVMHRIQKRYEFAE